MTSTMNRRAILAGAANLTSIAAAAQSVLAAPDPIFAAIEDHRRAWAELGAFVGDDKAAEVRLNRAIDAAEGALLEVIPTSIAGVVALFNYHVEFEGGGNEMGGHYLLQNSVGGWGREHGVDWSAALHHSLAKALPEIVARERASAA